MRKLRHDAVSYVLENGGIFHRLRLAHILGLQMSYRPLINDLLSFQNGDGGWPWLLEAGRLSGVSDTARVLGLLAVVGVGLGSDPVKRAVSYLLGLQNEDGGWSESPELDGIVPKDWTWVSSKYSGYQTAEAVNALLGVGYRGAEVDRAVDFLTGAQNDEGGWPSHVGLGSKGRTDLATTDHFISALLGSGVSKDSPTIKRAERMLHEKRDEVFSPIDAATTLSALIELGYPLEDNYVSELVDFLIEAQRPDGGWNWFEDLPSNPTQTLDCLELLNRFVEVKRPD